ncbi:sacsin-like [Orbicella faveolata]|uniref:sacsin-like n=1 Tax=Orbicella faveolata TaxID=48498 RepID=UPI0009E62845|nr:sacsin-like [Orbicella faveolata]
MQNSTMFRFPLRTKEMADNSKISNSPVTLPDLGDMMEALKGELFEVLLFVNNVRKITLCDIDEESGKVVNSYSVEAEMSEEDATKRQQFATYVKQVAKTGDKSDQFFPGNVKVKDCSYALRLRDSLGKEEKWLIVRKIGFDNEVPTSIVEAYKKGDLGMLPRGGIACLLEQNSKQGDSGTTRKKAYCFLPLPLETDLPVHVNGHFALDHEARRNLWRDQGNGYRSDWNNALLRDVIASCYLTLLDEVRCYLHLPITHSAEDVTPDYSKDALVEKIEEYENLFPLVVSGNPYWETLVRSVYQGMDKKRLRLLPVVRSTLSEAATPLVNLKWLPPTGEGKDEAFFNNLGESDCFAPRPGDFSLQNDPEKEEKRRLELKTSFEEILLETGFNLVKCFLSVYSAFQEAGVSSRCVSPSSVMEFYKTFNNEDPLCRIGSTYVDVTKTPFKNIDSVTLVLKYCKDDEHFLPNLPGLPLLVTQDNRLQEFSTSSPKFLSRHHGILPHCKEMFVHERVRIQVFGHVSCLQFPVFKRFGVQDFASNLHRTLPGEYCSADGYVRWSPTQGSVPNQPWLYKVWTFLNEETEIVLKEIESSEQQFTSICEIKQHEVRRIRTLLQPLSNWSVLPCTETIQMTRSSSESALVVVPEHFLVPLILAESVLDFTGPDANSRPLVEALKMLDLAEVNYAVLSLDSFHLASKLVASLKTPATLVKSLEQKMKIYPQALEGKLKNGQCRTILEYFSNNVENLQESDKKVLRRLPFYQATHGGLISVNSTKVCALPIGIPRKEMEELSLQLHVVFLEGWHSLSPLFKFLGFECLSAVAVYCNFILKNFDIFSSEGRLAHLKYIRDSILTSTSTSTLTSTGESDKERLLTCLKNTAIVTSEDGTLQKASSYYYPHNDVFKIMLSEDKFPPEPFNKYEWLLFLKRIGLIYEVSQDLFKTFATEVAREGARQQTAKTDEKSRVLVKHLFNREDVVEEDVLQEVRDVRFVAADPVGQELRNICGPFGGGRDGQAPYISFKGSVLAKHTKIVWTTAAVLPNWANPRNYQYNITVPKGWKCASDVCNAILSQLQILAEPTVDMVIFHCQNVSCQLAKENDVTPRPDQQQIRTSVMSNIYRFLQRKAVLSITAKERLQHIPCLLVEEGGRFVYAKQVIIELYKNLEIKPFLYGMPGELSEFKTLFKYLGCSPSVTPSHYAMVLDMLHGQCKANELEPNEVDSALRAVKGLLETMQDNPDAKQDISTLYLPATYPFSSDFIVNDTIFPVVLMKASELIFNDAPHYFDRVHDFNLPFVVDLKRANVVCKGNANYKDLIVLLPTAVQPKMMSCVIIEKFAESEGCSERFDVGAASSLRKQLHSEEFYRGIVRLIRHANQDCGLDEAVVATVRNNLQSIELLGMNKIVTHLVHNGEVIRGSEIEVPYFLEKVLQSGQEIWKVYVNIVEDAEETISAIILTLTEVIDEACKGLLRNTTHYISAMLLSQPGKIFSLLDRRNIRQDNSYDTDKGDVFPPPGSFIPIAMHNLLNPAFQAFTPGEYVGYELGDPSLELQEGDATYIYAVIIEEMPSDHASLLSKFYKINIGEGKEPQIVEATMLYKFHRAQEITSTQVALSDQQRSSHSTTDKQKIFDEISRALEEAWNLPEERRRRIVKRLFLQWHPDKNPGNEVFCTEVFQHIKSEIERLERGESRRGGSWSSTYGAFYGFWGRRARLRKKH